MYFGRVSFGLFVWGTLSAATAPPDEITENGTQTGACVTQLASYNPFMELARLEHGAFAFDKFDESTLPATLQNALDATKKG